MQCIAIATASVEHNVRNRIMVTTSTSRAKPARSTFELDANKCRIIKANYARQDENSLYTGYCTKVLGVVGIRLYLARRCVDGSINSGRATLAGHNNSGQAKRLSYPGATSLTSIWEDFDPVRDLVTISAA